MSLVCATDKVKAQATGIRDVRIGLGKPGSGQMLTIATGPKGDLTCRGDRTLPCTPADVEALTLVLKANGAGLRTLSLANADGTLACVTSDGTKCTLAHFAAWNQAAVAGPSTNGRAVSTKGISGSLAVAQDGGESIYCPKGQVERNGKCVNGDIPNNVADTVKPSSGNVPPEPQSQVTVTKSLSNIKNNLAVTPNVEPSGR